MAKKPIKEPVKAPKKVTKPKAVKVKEVVTEEVKPEVIYNCSCDFGIKLGKVCKVCHGTGIR
jgi:hypothetical protein